MRIILIILFALLFGARAELPKTAAEIETAISRAEAKLKLVRQKLGNYRTKIATPPNEHSQLRTRIYELFVDAGVTMAFPQQDVHLDTPRPIEVKVVGSSPLAARRAHSIVCNATAFGAITFLLLTSTAAAQTNHPRVAVVLSGGAPAVPRTQES